VLCSKVETAWRHRTVQAAKPRSERLQGAVTLTTTHQPGLCVPWLVFPPTHTPDRVNLWKLDCLTLYCRSSRDNARVSWIKDKERTSEERMSKVRLGFLIHYPPAWTWPHAHRVNSGFNFVTMNCRLNKTLSTTTSWTCFKAAYLL